MGHPAKKNLGAKDAKKAQRAQRRNVEVAMILINPTLPLKGPPKAEKGWATQPVYYYDKPGHQAGRATQPLSNARPFRPAIKKGAQPCAPTLCPFDPLSLCPYLRSTTFCTALRLPASRRAQYIPDGSPAPKGGVAPASQVTSWTAASLKPSTSAATSRPAISNTDRLTRDA